MNIFQRLISWAYFKYVDIPILEVPEGYEIEFIPEDELLENLENFNESLKALLEPTFENEIYRAMYEKHFATIH